jgi:hypothetical protein
MSGALLTSEVVPSPAVAGAGYTPHVAAASGRCRTGTRRARRPSASAAAPQTRRRRSLLASDRSGQRKIRKLAILERERVRVLCETCRAQPALAARAGEGPARARRPKPAPKPERARFVRTGIGTVRVRGLEAAASAHRAVRRPPRELPRRRDLREALQCVPSDRHGTGRRAVGYAC